MMQTVSVNHAIAQRLAEAADLLSRQGANPFRVNAYRRASQTVAALSEDLREIARERGADAIEELPGIGKGIAGAIREILSTGRWAQLERWRDTLDAEQLFMTVPGIGPDLAARLHGDLGLDTLEALETAAYDGRLASLPGIGERRLRAIRAGLAAQLGRERSQHVQAADAQPSVAELLAIDTDYHARAAAGRLKLIAPRRFNPTGEAWLPIMHATRRPWHYTALYSNTARAHQLNRTRDWVVIYFYDHDHLERSCTVVTESTGPQRGRRVVRGRESECQEYYSSGERRAAG